MCKLIQFIHPGAEHKLEPSAKRKLITQGQYHFPWNQGDHKRKFLQCVGKFVTTASDQTEQKADNLCIWCEAEWSTLVTPLSVPDKNAGYPRYLHHLLTPESEWHDKETNTDPYVFGKQFIYSCCNQNIFGMLQSLDPGDIILFGSTKKSSDNVRSFLLDTVFVVGNFTYGYATNESPEYIAKQCEGRLSEIFLNRTLRPIIGNPVCNHEKKDIGVIHYTLFFGATFDAKFKGIFSFVPVKIPCLTNTPDAPFPSGFKRFAITEKMVAQTQHLKGILSFKKTQGIKKTTGVSSVDVWKEIAELARMNDYCLGTHFNEI